MATDISQAAVRLGNPVMFVVDTLPLLRQAINAYEDTGLWYGVIQPDYYPDYSAPVQIVSQASYRARKSYANPSIIFIDESHVRYGVYDRMARENPGAKIIGLSASPWTKGLGEFYQQNIVSAQHFELIQKGVLVPITTYCPSKVDYKKLSVKAGEYVQGDEVKKPGFVGNILDHWLELASDRVTMVAAYDVAHSKQIVNEFKLKGIVADHIDGYNPDEAKVRIKDFEAGNIQVLSCVNLLSKGYDYKPASALILARRIRSLPLWYQWIGRVSRSSPGKENAIVLDHGGCIYESQIDVNTDALPTELDETPRRETSVMDALEKELPLCPKCDPPPTLIKGKCPVCGFQAQRQVSIAEIAGELEEFQTSERDKKRKNNKEQQLENWVSWLRWVQYNKKTKQNKTFKTGWIYARIKTSLQQDVSYDYIFSIPPKEPPAWFLKQVLKL